MTRPDILSPLFAPIAKLKGVGPRRQKLLEKLCEGNRILDLIAHSPRYHRKRLKLLSLDELPTEQKNLISKKITQPNLTQPNHAQKKITQTTPIAILLTVVEHIPPTRNRLPYRLICQDKNSVKIELLWFHAINQSLKQQFPPTKKITVCGSVTYYQGNAQITHPERILPDTEFENLNISEPQWRLTKGITRAVLIKVLDTAISVTPSLPEWLPNQLIDKYSYPNFRNAMAMLHKGEEKNSNVARARLACDELLAHQLAINVVKQNWTKQKNITQNYKKNPQILTSMLNEFHKQLHFEPTQDQKQAATEIQSDMDAEYPMLRLLQGDVGSGKTYVAACAMINAIANNGQALLMAPTDLLARQHLKCFKKWFEPLHIEVVLLSASMPKSLLNIAEKNIENGNAKIIIGTHALFQQKVQYKKLRIAVIDEQHKFGVYQRVALATKAEALNLLVMSATPIPRTLMLSVWGGINCSRLKQKPLGRKKISTSTITSRRIDEVILAIKRWRAQGEKIYWVCPHIKDSEIYSNIVSVQERTKILIKKFSEKTVVSMHAQMSAQAREKAMQQFADGEADILVATTMIEVGIDIPQARVIVIENAEHFGLAQLHQLRGRVGRDEKQARCILLFDPDASAIARERLAILRETQDGFQIAEEDWRLRGCGDTLGVRQSGLPQFLFADLNIHNYLAEITAIHAKKLINQIYQLSIEERDTLRVLLSLFEKNEGLLTIDAA